MLNNSESLNIKQILTLDTIQQTIINYGFSVEEIFNSLEEYKNLDETKDTVNNYINLMKELSDKINDYKVDNKQKSIFKSIFMTLFSYMASNECRGNIINTLANKNKNLIKKCNALYDELQKERDEYNELAKKYKEKDSIVSIPGISLSVTLKNNKPLSNQECIKIIKEVNNEEIELENKFKGLSLKNIQNVNTNNIDRVYIKKDDNNQVIQKIKCLKK